jgi:hypothetical protein
MDLKGIPMSFWHSASFALIAFTIGFLFISYKSGELTIKFNQLEVRTSDTVALEKTLENQKESIIKQKEIIDKRETKVAELEVLLKERLKELNKVKVELAQLHQEMDSAAAKAITSKIEAINENQDFDLNVNKTQKTLDSLQTQQQQQQDIYKQQQQMFQQQQQRKY